MYDPDLEAEEPSRVTWEIDPQENGTCLLTVTHDRLEGARCCVLLLRRLNVP